MAHKKLKMVLVGNPNSGKTTLFNYITGSKGHVGNHPGVTVEKKESSLLHAGRYGLNTETTDADIVDLPGIYSLSPYSMEEIISRDCIIHDKPDVIINIIDATNLERNLYLTTQILEMHRPVVIALNMMDEMEAHGNKVDTSLLSKLLRVPVMPISAKTGIGIDELMKKAVLQISKEPPAEPYDMYDSVTVKAHSEIENIIFQYAEKKDIPLHWAAIKMLEGDHLVQKLLELPESEFARVEKIAAQYEKTRKEGDREEAAVDFRYSYIERTVSKTVLKNNTNNKTLTDKIDSVLTHRLFGIPIFLGVMFVIFMLTFSTLGAFLQDTIAGFIENVITPGTLKLLDKVNVHTSLKSLLTDGIIDGVGGVLSFLPQIAILFGLLSILEDSGYMARIAFMTDRILSKFGLSGKSFIPMLMGFGCTVPAVMAARTMGSEKERRMTILIIPFMSCSAKLPIYGFLARIFFPEHSGLVVFSLYLIGIILGILTGLLLKNTLFKGAEAPFILELPPYRVPELKNTLRHIWEKTEHFIKKAATLIFLMSILMWFLKSFDFALKYTENGEKSMLGILGSFIAPVFKLSGFGTWQAAVALLTGFVAKEAVVSSLCLFYGISSSSGASAAAVMSGTFGSAASAFAFLVFTLLYVPCMASFATMKRELGSAKWAVGSAAYQIIIAYIMSIIVYRIGLWLL